VLATTVAVVGLGKIGLPLAAQLASKGMTVIGCDTQPDVIETINSGHAHIREEAGLEQAVAAAVTRGTLSATLDTTAAVKKADVIVVIVPLMVGPNREPDYANIDGATHAIGLGLHRGALVIYETTLPVGTTRGRLGPMLEEASGMKPGRDFQLAFSPERLYAGRVFEDLRQYPKIVGGVDARSTEAAVEFYRSALDAEVWPVESAETAEFAKLAETTYRDVNIALANEYARYAARRGIDVLEVIGAANSQPFSNIHQPGVGVGGHCIPVYPHFLFNGDPDLRLPPLARAINEEMGAWTVALAEERVGSLRGEPVLVLGIEYRADVREDAFSSAFRLRDELKAGGARVYGHDPYFPDDHLRRMGFEPYDLAAPAEARVAILQAGHAAYGELDPRTIPGLELFIDGRNALERATFDTAGVAYVGIGR